MRCFRRYFAASAKRQALPQAPETHEQDGGHAQAEECAEGGFAFRGEMHVHGDGFVRTHSAGAPDEWIVTYTAEGGFEPEHIDMLADDTVPFVNAPEWGARPASNIHPTHEILPEFEPPEPIPR